MEQNPYQYHLPTEEHMFFGRREELQQVVNGVTFGRGRSFALVGGRRMGKTSLLRQIQQTIERGSQAQQYGLLVVPILIALDGKDLDSVASFVRMVYNETLHTLVTRWGLQGTLIEIDHQPQKLVQAPKESFHYMLRRWETINEGGHKLPLRFVLLLDECEAIVGQPWAADLHTMLRSALEDSRTESLLKLVMAGSHGFLSQVRQRTSPLWGVLDTCTLQTLSLEECRQLVTQPLGGLLRRGTVTEVVHQSGGHPFLTQYLMFHLCSGELERATVGKVRQIAALLPPADHSQARQIFRSWMRDIGEFTPIVYDLLASSKSGLSLAQIRTQLDLTHADLDDVLNALVYHGLICSDEAGQHYKVAGEMFRSWFRSQV